jgi:transcriptional regulator with XRE-family HTH domain
MTTRTKKLATLLVGGVALSSGAYALGTQSGDGGAVAAGTSSPSPAAGSGTTITQRRDRGPHGFGRRGDLGLSTLAGRLGVSQTALRDALRALLTGKTPEQRRAELTQALATALNKPAPDVQSALDSALPDRRGRKDDLSAAIAKELGVDAAKVQAAFDKLGQGLRGRRGNGNGDRRGDPRTALVDAIASATGADAARVRAALDKVRQDLAPRRGDRRGDARQRLADALKVTPEQLQAAFDKVRTDQRNAFATALAQRLSIDVAKVQSALQALPRLGGGRHHG